MTINNVTLVGRLTKDPELRFTPSGVATCTFTLAINRPFSGQNGEREADFINIVVWRKPAENAANFLKKGSLAGVVGRIQTRNYDGQDGRKVYVTEVVAENVQFLEPRSSGVNNTQSQSPPRQQNNSMADDPFAGQGTPIDISDDDLPF